MTKQTQNYSPPHKNQKKRRWLIYFAIFLALLLIISAILSALTPDQPKIPPSELNSTAEQKPETIYQQISYEGGYPEFPSVLPIAQARVADIKTELINQFMNRFNLKVNEPNILWVSDEASLNAVGEFLIFTNYNTRGSTGESKTLSATEGIEVAYKFLQNYLPQYNVVPIRQEVLLTQNRAIEYRRNLSESTENQPESAEMAIIPFSYSLANYPIYYQDDRLPFVEIIVTADSGVTKATFQTRGLKYETTTEIPLISIDQAVANIQQNNQATIITYETNYAQELNLATIQTGILNAVQLEYRVDEENQLIYPFYRFEGEFINQDGLELTGQLITPAVEISKE